MKNFKMVVFVVLAILIFTISGCSKASPNNDSQLAPPVKENATTKTQSDTNSGGANNSSSSATIAATERKLVVTSTIELQTKEFDNTNTKVNSACVEAGGYIESSNVEGKRINESKPRSATYKFRVPASKLNNFKTAIKNSGSVVTDNVSSSDVTNQYFDTEGRLASVKAQRENLRKLADKTSTLADLVMLQKEIENVEYEIERLTTTLKKLDSLTELSAVNVTIKEVDEIKVVEIVTPTFWSKIGDAFNSSISFLTSAVQIILIVISWLSPFLLIVGVVLAIIIILKKKGKFKK